MSAFCLLCSVKRWFLSTSHSTDAVNGHSITDLSHVVFFAKINLPVSNLPPGGKHFDTQTPRRGPETMVAIIHVGQLQTLSVSLPSWEGHRAGALNAAGFPGTDMKYGNEVGLAEAGVGGEG